MALDIVVLAAGKGTRMKSALPKVLHRLAGRPLLLHVLDACAALQARRTVVVTGHAAEAVERCVASREVHCVRQQPQLGTGHAVQQAAPLLGDDGTTLVLSGDVPLIGSDTARALAQACSGRALALLTLQLDDPGGYGRIVREGDAVRGIVEHKDASAAQRAIREVYTGIMAAPSAALKRWLARLSDDNAQREYYLTDVVAMAVADGVPVVTRSARDETEVLGVNSAAQLADLERRVQRRNADALMAAGVRLADPARIDVRGELLCGSDVEIDVNCVFEGRVAIGDGAKIGAHCVIRDTTIGAGAQVLPFCHFTDAAIGEAAQVGPFARLRPGAQLGPEVHIGNFVEVKNSTLARGAKANHLAYLGDSTVGERVNYGAGSITANYDGAAKHRTVLGADVHVGSNCVLVAPVTVGDGATIGAGSVISKAAPAGQLTVARARQTTIGNWTRPAKKKKEKA
ncbi:MAG: bifunctional UDP-N-acetylglucosamine diphosphorylase/glucosamine-1-phosphate N-acetyltransferase GlmU [Burkholderiaceae bacterium]|nr:bifunctional UDP-N-acetylglucosamine diphosphorylase/glucosamine-1-phosphate N-acetyltransferase GlmU [Ideonella sp.]MCC7286944.1 bifunctional UDP-N-acetylglucosamine diphosphorylase/glucosamine-1-phosphate N-acetyltransferase GlmU [Burkholderiaceae bacterium]